MRIVWVPQWWSNGKILVTRSCRWYTTDITSASFWSCKSVYWFSSSWLIFWVASAESFFFWSQIASSSLQDQVEMVENGKYQPDQRSSDLFWILVRNHFIVNSCLDLGAQVETTKLLSFSAEINPYNVTLGKMSQDCSGSRMIMVCWSVLQPYSNGVYI